MISLDKCNWICNNVVGDISAIVCVSSKTKGVNVKVFKMITRMNGGKALVKHLSCCCKCKFHKCKCKFKNGIIKDVNETIKTIKHAKKVVVGILVHVFVKMVRFKKYC